MSVTTGCSELLFRQSTLTPVSNWLLGATDVTMETGSRDFHQSQRGVGNTLNDVAPGRLHHYDVTSFKGKPLLTHNSQGAVRTIDVPFDSLSSTFSQLVDLYFSDVECHWSTPTTLTYPLSLLLILPISAHSSPSLSPPRPWLIASHHYSLKKTSVQYLICLLRVYCWEPTPLSMM